MIITLKDLLVFALISAVLAFFLSYDVVNWGGLGMSNRAAVALTALLGLGLLALEARNLERRCDKLKEIGSWEGVSGVRVPILGDGVDFRYLSHEVRFSCRLATKGLFSETGMLACEISTPDEGPDVDYLKEAQGALAKELEAFSYTYKLVKAARKGGRLMVAVAMPVDLRRSHPWAQGGGWEEEDDFSKTAILDSLRLVNRLRERKE
jgi:hypothetical protein